MVHCVPPRPLQVTKSLPALYVARVIALTRVILLETEISLSSRGSMTLEVEAVFWFISHTLPQCHALQGIGDIYL
jgi:biotin synthase-like enzyme